MDQNRTLTLAPRTVLYRARGPRYTSQQLSEFKTRMDALRRDWEAARRSFFIGGKPPSGARGALAVGMMALGVMFLALSQGILPGLCIALLGAGCTLLWLIRAVCYRLAEREYLRRRSRIRIEDCRTIIAHSTNLMQC